MTATTARPPVTVCSGGDKCIAIPRKRILKNAKGDSDTGEDQDESKFSDWQVRFFAKKMSGNFPPCMQLPHSPLPKSTASDTAPYPDTKRSRRVCQGDVRAPILGVWHHPGNQSPKTEGGSVRLATV